MSTQHHESFDDAFATAVASLASLKETFAQPCFMVALWRIDPLTGRIHMDWHTWQYPYSDMPESIRMLERAVNREPELEPLPQAEPLARRFDV